jgi:hypothetical protein
LFLGLPLVILAAPHLKREAWEIIKVAVIVAIPIAWCYTGMRCEQWISKRQEKYYKKMFDTQE